MPSLTITKNYADGSTLTKAQLDAAMDSISSFLNSTKIDSSNIQTGGISSANLASSCVTASKIDTSAVGTSQIADASVTLAKMGTLSVDTGQLVDSSVTTAKIAANAVTRAKMASVGQQVSSSSGNYSGTQSTFTAVTNLSVSITTTGRPVRVELVSDGGGSASYVGNDAYSGTVADSAFVQILRDSTEIAQFEIISYNSSFNTHGLRLPPSAFAALDAASAGTYTYSVKMKKSAGSVVYRAVNVKLVAYEL